MTPARVREVLSFVCPEGPASAVARAFELMEVAEREIAGAMAAAPRRAHARLDASFGLLVPGVTARYGERVYLAHVREILRRVARGEDTRPGTDAEVLCALSAASLVAPLPAGPARLMASMFLRVYPELRGHPDWRDVEAEVGREYYPGQVEQLERDLRRRAAQADRVLSEEKVRELAEKRARRKKESP